MMTSSCFFCSGLARKDGYQFSLRLFTQYLKSFHEDADSNDNDANKRKRRGRTSRNDVPITRERVSLCQDCSKLTKEFHEFYLLMEEEEEDEEVQVIKLRLNWCIRRLYEKTNEAKATAKVSPKSGVSQSQGKKFKLEESECGSGIDGALRTKIMGRMKLISSYPRVVLHRIKLSPRSSKKSSPVNLNTSVSNLVNLLVSKPNGTAAAPTKKRQLISINSIKKSNPPSRKTTKSKSPSNFTPRWSNFIPSDKDKSRCKLCGKELNRDRSSMHSHWNYDCPKGLCRQREEDDSKNGDDESWWDWDAPMETDIKIPVTSESSPEIVMINDDDDNDDDDSDDDPMIPILVKSKKRKSSSKKKDPLSAAPTTTATPSATSSFQDKDKTFVTCSLCRAKFAAVTRFHSTYGKNSLLKHMLKYHTDHYFPQKKLDTVTDAQFQKILAELLFQGLVKGKMSCLYCQKPFIEPSDRSDFDKYYAKCKLHYIENHYCKLERKLRHIQNDPNLEEILAKCNPEGVMCKCGIYLPSSRHRGNHDRLHCVLNTTTTATTEPDCDSSSISISTLKKEQDQLPVKAPPKKKPPSRCSCNAEEAEDITSNLPNSCPYCRFQDSSTTTMAKHLLSFHPQYYFPQVDSEILGVTSDQIQRVLQDIIFSEDDPNPSPNSSKSCKKTFDDQDQDTKEFPSNLELRRHLIASHKTEVTEKIRLFLKSSTLVDRLAKANPKGASCLCGMYLPRGLSYKEWYHERIQCNLKGKDKEEEEMQMEIDVKMELVNSSKPKIQIQENGENSKKELDFLSQEEEEVKSKGESVKITEDDQDKTLECKMEESDTLKVEGN